MVSSHKEDGQNIKCSRVKCKTKYRVHRQARCIHITISCQTPTGCRSEVITAAK